METERYGQQPSDLDDRHLLLGWLKGVRHLQSLSATGSFWHVHDAVQLLFCIKGEFGYEFEARESVILTAGHVIVIPAGLPHRHVQAIDPAGHRVELLLAHPRARRLRLAGLASRVYRDLVAQLLTRRCRPIPVSKELAALFAELDGYAARGANALSATETALARTVATLILLRAADPHRAPAVQGSTRLMAEAVEWLKAHHAENVRIDRLVAYMGYSKSRFFTLFKAHTGLTPADWLGRYRIRQAQRKLRATALPVAQVAAETGFASPQYFIAAFRRHTGFTPTQWRLYGPSASCAADAPPARLSGR